MHVLLGKDTCMEGVERVDSSVKSKEGDGQKKMDGTGDENTMIIVCTRDGRLTLIQ